MFSNRSDNQNATPSDYFHLSHICLVDPHLKSTLGKIVVEVQKQSVYEEYVKKLNEISSYFGFGTERMKTSIGQLDVKWRDNRFDSVLEKGENLPVVVFEGVCSEDHKDLRGSLLNIMSAKPLVGVFVLARSEIHKAGKSSSHRTGKPEGKKWLKRNGELRI